MTRRFLETGNSTHFFQVRIFRFWNLSEVAIKLIYRMFALRYTLRFERHRCFSYVLPRRHLKGGACVDRRRMSKSALEGVSGENVKPPLALDAVNAFDVETFAARFGDVAEASPWVAEAAFESRPFGDRDALVEAFGSAVRGASDRQQLALLRAHPDLAGRAAVAGEIAKESRREQVGAGLDRLTDEEFVRFQESERLLPRALRVPVHLRGEGGDEGCRSLRPSKTRIDNDAGTWSVRRRLRMSNASFRFRIEDRVAP